MATTRDYLGYLNDQIEIAPANSQEELLAAGSIQQIMEEHGLDVQLQEFDTPGAGRLPYRILMLVLFLGVFLSGLQGTPASIVGVIVVGLCAILFLLSLLGFDVLSGIGPRARSQNVIGLHRAEGPLVTKGSRPIVVVAHYDTPRESFLYSSPLARIQRMLKRLAPIFIVVACLLGLLQVVAILPGAVRRVVWVVGIVSTLPLLVLGVEGIYARVSSCTDGANDNKSGVAAMLGVLGMVRPQPDSADGYGKSLGETAVRDGGGSFDDSTGFEEDRLGAVREGVIGEGAEGLGDSGYGTEEPEPAEDLGTYAGSDSPEDEADLPDFLAPAAPSARGPEPQEDLPSQVITERYERIEGIRHGKDVLSDLRMLPNSCEIVYVEPQLVSRSMRPQHVETRPQPAPLPEVLPQVEDEREPLGLVSDEDVSRPEAASYGSYDAYDEYGAYDDGEMYEDEQWDEEVDKGPSIFERIKERFAQVRERLGRRRAAEDEVEPVSKTGIFEALPSEDDDEILDFGVEDNERVSRIRASVPEVMRKVDRGHTDEYDDTEYDDDEDYVEYEEYDYDYSADDAPSHYGSAPQAYGDEDEASVEDTADYPEISEGAWDDSQADESESGAWVMEDAEGVDEDAWEPEASEGSDTQEDEPGDRGSDDGSWTDDDDSKPASEGSAEPRSVLAPNLQFETEPDPTDEEMAMRDVAGLDVEVPLEPDGMSPLPVEERPRPASVDDPSWGRSEYQPQNRSSFGRRAALYDLPDPTAASIDPFANDDDASDDYLPTVRSRRRGSQDDVLPMGDWFGDEDARGAEGEGDGFADDPRDASGGRARRWKGGATTRSGLRGDDAELADGYEGDQPSEYGQEELREAILHMGDDELVAHDIWFVALGASELENGGMKAFLSKFRPKIRGAFLINIDCVGGGELSTYTREGLFASRRTDRRLASLLTNVADDLHIPLDSVAHDHGDTDATPAMRASVRAVTISGLTEAGVPAFSHTMDDVIENIDAAQVTSVADMVSELIRRA